jgi:hypothetical protein
MMKYFMIGGDKQEYGPVDAELVRQWVREGRANGETLLRLENETEWRPLRAFADLQNGSGPPPLPTWATAPEAVEPRRDVKVRVGHSFARAWHLVGEHFGTVAGATFMVWICFTAMLYAPCLGPILAMLFYGPLFGGLYLVFLKLIRGEETSAGDVFTLTRDTAMPLMLTGVLTLLLVQIGMVACLLPGIYLFIAWLFSLPLVADRGLNFWEAMETSRRAISRHWFKIFPLFILAFLPFVGFHIYLRGREMVDLAPQVEKLMAMVQQYISNGTQPNPTEVQTLAKNIEEVQRSYGGWRLFRQFLFLLALPLGVGSLAFVYEDLFGRKK